MSRVKYVANKMMAIVLGGCAGAMFSNLFTKHTPSMVICTIVGMLLYYFVISKEKVNG